MSNMNKRVFGVIGIVSKMANWNADFNGYPKTTSKGDVYGSDKALKFPMKKMWKSNGMPVLYIKTLKLSDSEDGSLVPRSLTESYQKLFDVADLKAQKNVKEVATNLFKAVDVKQFGATFAEAGKNISITGAVQIGQGFNKYDEAMVEEQQILSPFRDATKDGKKQEGVEAQNSTIGSKIVSDEAHYVYPFTINPHVYDEFVDLGITEGYTEEDYENFKDVAIISTTSYSTNSKMGCDNELALFVETADNYYLPSLAEYVTFVKGEDGEKNTIQIALKGIVNPSKVQNVEVYYNPSTTNLEIDVDAKVLNIYTRTEV